MHTVSVGPRVGFECYFRPSPIPRKALAWENHEARDTTTMASYKREASAV